MTPKSTEGAHVQIMDLDPENISDYRVCGYKGVKKHLEPRRKSGRYRKYHHKRLRIKALVTKDGGYQGMTEYTPGKYAHRPVNVSVIIQSAIQDLRT
ncbi:MAG: hypothetical protein ACLFTW_10510 [Chitinispirillaceae bacterium]